MRNGLAGFIATILLAGAPLFGATERELKDADGKTIIRYVVEAPEHIAAAGTRDPAKQVGLILCSAEHDRPTGDEIYPVREALKRLGLSDGYVLLAGHSQAQKFGPADDEPIEKLIRVGDEDLSGKCTAHLHVREGRGREDFG